MAKYMNIETGIVLEPASEMVEEQLKKSAEYTPVNKKAFERVADDEAAETAEPDAEPAETAEPTKPAKQPKPAKPAKE